MHFVRKRVSSGMVKITKIDSDDNIADIFTKSLTAYKHHYLVNQMGLIDPFSVE